MYLPLALPPGLFRNGTVYQAKGRYYDANLIRFYEGTIRPIGGWRTKNFTGTDSNPFTTVNTSATVTVTHTSHGLRVGDRVNFANAATVGGLNMNAVNWTVASVVDANNYTFTHTSNATSSAGPAGGTTNFTYTQKVAGSPRAIYQWKDNSLVARAAIGTHSKLYVMNRGGQLFDITPAGFTAGRADATSGGGYGAGPYGVSTYGTPRGDASNISDATVASLDTWGQDIVFCTPEDGKLYEWVTASGTGTVAAQISGAPTSCSALIVTDQRILMAFGAGGNPRTVQWSDQENNTQWTPAATNQAGSFNLQTAGRIMLGSRFRGAVVILTDLDAHLASYTGDVFVYSFQKVGDSCGAISRKCAVSLDSAVVWMGKSAFWNYNGFVAKLPCDVSDAVFSNINTTQSSKVTCFVNSQYSEVTWHYPSAASLENDSYVTWNYRENHWVTGTLARLCGSSRGALLYPLLCGSDGFIYEHEVSASLGYSGAMPWLESGPVELSGGLLAPSNGDRVMYATQLVPDELTQGQVTASFKTRFYPNAAESTFGPYTLNEPTDVRFCGRQVRLRYDGKNLTDWRVGVPRLQVKAGGPR